MLQGELNAHPNHPVLRLQCDRSDVTECSTTAVQVEEAMGEGEESSLHPDPAAAGETSSQVVAVTTGSDSSQDSEDDFCSCISDDDDDA